MNVASIARFNYGQCIYSTAAACACKKKQLQVKKDALKKDNIVVPEKYVHSSALSVTKRNICFFLGLSQQHCQEFIGEFNKWSSNNPMSSIIREKPAK